MLNRKQHSYQFDLDIERVQLLVNMRCEVQIWWKSGKSKITTKNHIKLLGTEKYFDIHEKLSIIAKLIQENSRFLQKKTELLILLFIGQNTSKIGGKVFLNLNEFVNDDINKQGIKKIQTRLANCPDENSRITFNLSWKYIENNMQTSSYGQSLNDVSFQANNFSSNMTFRPKQQAGYAGNEGGYRQRSKEKREFGEGSYHRKEQYPPNKPQKPMQFSFNPSQSQRQKLGIDNSQLVKDLKGLVEQKNQEIRNLKETIEQLKVRERLKEAEKQKMNSSRSLSLMNQLNSAVAEKQALQKQVMEMNKKYSHLREETRMLESQLQSVKVERERGLNKLSSQKEEQKGLYQEKISEWTRRAEQSQKKCSRLQDQIFRKEDELLTKQSQFQKNKALYESELQKYKTLHEGQLQKYKMMLDSAGKQSADQLKNISKTLQQVKIEYQKTYEEKEQERRRAEIAQSKLTDSERQCNRLGVKLQELEENMIKERDLSKKKYSLLEQRFQERESVIREIEEEFRKLSHEKSTGAKAKEEQIGHLRQKFNASCRKIDELAQRQQSYKNQISTLNIRIKSLENICEQNEKSEKALEQKQQLLEKAKEYIKAKEDEILQRDEFIDKAKTYIEGKERQLEHLKSAQHNNQTASQHNYQIRIKNYEEQIAHTKQTIFNKQAELKDIAEDRNKLIKQIADMENYIDILKQKLMDYQDNFQQLHRKIEHQQQTLQDLVKKNLDMQIQLNVKTFQLQTLKGN